MAVAAKAVSTAALVAESEANAVAHAEEALQAVVIWAATGALGDTVVDIAVAVRVGT